MKKCLIILGMLFATAISAQTKAYTTAYISGDTIVQLVETTIQGDTVYHKPDTITGFAVGFVSRELARAREDSTRWEAYRKRDSIFILTINGIIR